jgi:hypothetical protein
VKRDLKDVHAGQIWRDRDKRMLSGNRRVHVESVVRDCDPRSLAPRVTVNYRAVSWNGAPLGPSLKSRYDRFQRAFDLVEDRHD